MYIGHAPGGARLEGPRKGNSQGSGHPAGALATEGVGSHGDEALAGQLIAQIHLLSLNAFQCISSDTESFGMRLIAMCRLKKGSIDGG